MNTNPVTDALPSTAPYLTLRGVEKGYGTVPVLRGIDLDLPRGTITAITGPSGAGKTTLLMIMGTLMRPDRGEVRILGQDPAALRPRALAALRRRAIGLVFQSPRLLPELSALENAALPLLLHGTAPRRARAQAEQCLRAIGLGDRLGHRPPQLSGGEAARVAIARAVALRPPILLADEPAAALPPADASSGSTSPSPKPGPWRSSSSPGTAPRPASAHSSPSSTTASTSPGDASPPGRRTTSIR